MQLADRIQLIPRQRRADHRGYLLKLLSGSEPRLSKTIGEVYVTFSVPGEIRGNHYHPRTAEWFTVIQGNMEVELLDPDTSERIKLELTADDPKTLYVPPGVAHAFRTSPGAPPSLLHAYADQPYDPVDTVPCVVLPTDAA